jgi:hypothetical protein
MAKRERVTVELQVTGTRLQNRGSLALLKEIMRWLEGAANVNIVSRGGYGLDDPSTLELLRQLNAERDLDYLLGCMTCPHCQKAKEIIRQLRERLKETL